MSTTDATDTAAITAGGEVPRLAGTSRPLWLHIFERKLLLGAVDFLLINFTFFVTLALRPLPLRRGFHPTEQLIVQLLRERWSWFLILSVVWFVCALMLDCYNLTRAASVGDALRPIALAVTLTSSIYLLIPRVTPALPTSRLDILSFPIVGLLTIGTWRALYATLLVQPNFQQRALVIGAGAAGSTLVGAIARMGQRPERAHRDIGYRVLGFVDDDATKQGTMVEGVPVVGTSHELVDLAARLQPNDLVVAITHPETMHAELFDAILACHEMGIGITTMAALYERLTGRVPIEHAGRTLSVTLSLGRPATHRAYLVLKRLVDVGVGLLGCLLLLPVVPLVWLINRLVSPGPLLYSQERVGRSGQPFAMFKFRSMVVDAEKDTGAIWAIERDPRITAFGRFLRRTRLDEFPQFWSVLKGDMSLIGPRPERPYFVAQLSEQLPFYRVRHAVKPGLTGWGQVMYRYGASVEDARTKLEYDLYYIKRQGLLLDLHILLKTVPVVIGLKGR